jgi:hypothetical protein
MIVSTGLNLGCPLAYPSPQAAVKGKFHDNYEESFYRNTAVPTLNLDAEKAMQAPATQWKPGRGQAI